MVTRDKTLRAALPLLLLATTVGAATLPALAAVPEALHYQGRLTDTTPQQNPLDATVDLEFRIYDAPVGGALLWSESWPGVSVEGGLFSIRLGTGGVPIPTSVFAGGSDRFLEIVVAGEVFFHDL